MSESKILVIDEYPVILSPVLAQTYGVASAAFLQKLHYFLQSQKTQWWYHSYLDWVKSIGLYSIATIKRCVKKLKDEGILIVEKLSKSKWIQTNSYSINYKKLASLFTAQAEEITPVPQHTTTVKDAVKSALKPKIANHYFRAEKPLASQASIVGSVYPLHAAANMKELAELSMAEQKTYHALRELKIDVCYTDPMLASWAKGFNLVIQLAERLKRSCPQPAHWHTPSELKLDLVGKNR